jgi:putative redox protein
MPPFDAAIPSRHFPLCGRRRGALRQSWREIELFGVLDSEQRARLLEIANHCPVHRTLTGEIKARTRLQ